jgi:hypothetical protein
LSKPDRFRTDHCPHALVTLSLACSGSGSKALYNRSHTRFECLDPQSEISDHDGKIGGQLTDDRQHDDGDRFDLVLSGFGVAVQRTV